MRQISGRAYGPPNGSHVCAGHLRIGTAFRHARFLQATAEDRWPDDCSLAV
jgi:hypothetical protein